MRKFQEFLSLLPEAPESAILGNLLSFLERAKGIGIAYFDEMLICRYADERFTELAELPLDKLYGLQLQSIVRSDTNDLLIPPEKMEMAHASTSKVVEHAYVSPVTFSERRVELIPFWLNGECIGIVAAICALQERSSSQQYSFKEIQLSRLLSEIECQPRLEKVFAGMSGLLIALLDDEGRLEYLSRAARQKLGIGLADAVNYNISLDSNFTSLEYASLVKDALVGGEVHLPAMDYATDLPGALGYGSGITFRASVTLAQAEESAGKTGIIMLLIPQMGIDLTQPATFMQRSESVAMLARGVAHEFNNIFAAIKGITSLLRSEVEYGGFVDDYLGKLDIMIDRGVKLISDLTSYARSSEPKMERVPVDEFFSNLKSLVEFMVPREVKLEFGQEAQGWLECDKNSLRQGLFNLIQNSLDAIKDSPEKRIRISVSEVDPADLHTGLFHFAASSMICVSVADSGPGIPAELAARIFEPYFSSKDPQRSSGLGLNVSQQIFRRHGGLLLAERVGLLGGAQFNVYLPLRKQS